MNDTEKRIAEIEDRYDNGVDHGSDLDWLIAELRKALADKERVAVDALAVDTECLRLRGLLQGMADGALADKVENGRLRKALDEFSKIGGQHGGDTLLAMQIARHALVPRE